MEQKRIEFTTEDTKVIKAVAVMLMIVHHLFAFPDRLWGGVTYIALFPMGGGCAEEYLANFGKICVAMFLFVGGYGTFLACRGKNHQELMSKIGRKILSLYQYYWMVFVVFVPMLFICGTPIKLSGLINNFLGREITYVGEWWFFRAYVGLMIFYPLLHKIDERFHNVLPEILMVIALDVLAMYALPFLPSYKWASKLPDSVTFRMANQAAQLLPAFWMGCVFAKYDLLAKAKQRLSGNALYCLGALLVTGLCVYMRNDMWVSDVILAPIFIISIIVALNNKMGKWVRKILLYIGTESTFIWLTHSIYCYKLCQRIVFAPKYTILIVIWLLIMCLVTAKILRLLMKGIGLGWRKVKPLFVIQSLED